MARLKLSENELDSLIAKYRSDKIQLQFQLEQVDRTLEDLEVRRATLDGDVPKSKRGRPKKKTSDAKSKSKSKSGKKRGRPKGSKNKSVPEKNTQDAAPEVVASPPKRRGRPPGSKNKSASPKTKTTTPKAKSAPIAKSSPKEQGEKGYRLSVWDEFVIDTIGAADKLLGKKDIDEAALANKAKLDADMEDKQVVIKIANVLHKLSNTRDTLKKYSMGGRKAYYGLKEWFFDNTGEIKKKYIPKA
ncbi:MAG: hypothetical protein AAF206_21780 [Bacteroidota bacterium]